MALPAVQQQLEAPIHALTQTVGTLRESSNGMNGVAARITEMKQGFQRTIAGLETQVGQLTARVAELEGALGNEARVAAAYKVQIEALTQQV
jgi:ABC-type transporter Mla subunit MlaD